MNNQKCSKIGIKIHETKMDNHSKMYDPEEFYNKIKNENRHTGVRITNVNNEYKEDPFDNINPFKNPNGDHKKQPIKYEKSSYNQMDLNMENYSIEDLFNLFGLNDTILTEENMKEAKKTVLKTHPDKSQLEPKYFLFFSQAYKRLLNIYQFQNKNNNNKKQDYSEYYSKENSDLLDKMFDTNKTLKKTENFNKWFNEQFEKHKSEDTNETGYGDWLKSNDDIVDLGNISQANMASEIEKRKKHVQSIIQYNGVDDIRSSAFGGSTLMDYNNNYTSGTIFSNDGMGYTDLKQAYIESVIPITEEDYKKIPKFKSVDEYKRHRENIDTKPLSKEEGMRQLYHQNKQLDDESAALAFHYAKQSEKVKQNTDSFWSSLQHITYK
jgi:hypothetical protein